MKGWRLYGKPVSAAECIKVFLESADDNPWPSSFRMLDAMRDQLNEDVAFYRRVENGDFCFWLGGENDELIIRQPACEGWPGSE